MKRSGMTYARLIVEEYDEINGGTLQEDWGLFQFASPPVTGDIIRVGHDGQSRDVKVLRVLHLPSSEESDAQPALYIIGEW